eukprot:6212599-Pleurochrysis_carterae.AAC.4
MRPLVWRSMGSPTPGAGVAFGCVFDGIGGVRRAGAACEVVGPGLLRDSNGRCACRCVAMTRVRRKFMSGG